MSRFVSISLAVALTCWMQPAAPEPLPNSSDARTALAMEVLTVTDAKARVMTMVGILEPTIFKLIGEAHPELGQKAVDAVRVAVHEEIQESMNDLLRQEAQVYVKHFSETDMRSLLAFYKTDTGKKLLTEMPAVMKESAVVGQVWGRQVGIAASQRVIARLRHEGYKI